MYEYVTITIGLTSLFFYLDLDQPIISKLNIGVLLMNLSCISSGLPPPNFKWFKDSTLVSTLPMISLTDVKGNDTSIYQCTVSNSIGSFSATTSTVKDCKPVYFCPI